MNNLSKRKNNWPSQEPNATPEETTEMIVFHRQIMELPAVNLKDPDAIKERIEWYLSFCEQSGRRPFVEGLAAALKTSRQNLWNIANENTRRGEVVREAKALILALLESFSIEGKLNPANSIFWLKNLGHYTDTVTIEAKPADTEKPELSPEQIAKQIESDIPLDYIEVQDNAE